MPRQLGFGPVPDAIFIYVSQESKQCCWYRIDDYTTNVHIPITEPALTGIVTGLRLKEVDQGSFGKKVKLDLFVSADRRYVIRSTYNTAFVRGLMLHLLAVPDITQPITIAVSPGNQGKTVFANIYDHHDQPIKVDTDNQTTTEDLIVMVADLLKCSAETEPATPSGSQAQASAGSNSGTMSEEDRLAMQTEYIVGLGIEKGLVIVDGDLRMTDGLAKDCWERYKCSYMRLPRDKAKEYVDILRAM